MHQLLKINVSKETVVIFGRVLHNKRNYFRSSENKFTIFRNTILSHLIASQIFYYHSEIYYTIS